MNELAAQNLINIVQIVDSRYRRKIDWLLQLHPSFDAIVNFGCHIGSETIALALLLNAKEVIGLDKEPDSIMQANDQVKTIWEDIESVRRDLYYESGQDKGDRGALQSLLQSFAGKVAPTFVEADVLVVAKLLENHFDLVYCESFLYHFTCENEQSVRDHTVNVIRSMKKVTKPGGLIVAVEPIVCSINNHRPVDLTPVFDRVGLVKVDVNYISPQIDGEAIYVYRKEAK